MKVVATNGKEVKITQEIIDFLDYITDPLGVQPLDTLKICCYNINMFLSSTMCIDDCPTDEDIKEQVMMVQQIYHIVKEMMKAFPEQNKYLTNKDNTL